MYVDWLLNELSSATASRPRQLWERAVLMKCHMAASAGRWQVIKDLLAEASPGLSQGPTTATAKFWLAEAEFRTGNYDEARTAFLNERAAELGKGFSPLGVASSMTIDEVIEPAATRRIIAEHLRAVRGAELERPSLLANWPLWF